MRILIKFPHERYMLIKAINFYVKFLWGAAFFSFFLTALWTWKIELAHALVYLTASTFFVSSALMYSELYETLRKMRFVMYWKFFSKYSPPFGSYAIMHILVGIIFVIADIFKGGYFPIIIVLVGKGFFEHALSRIINEIRIASLLYDALIEGDFDRLSLKDPFS